MKLAACFSQDGIGSNQIVQKMLQAQTSRDFHEPRVFAVKNGAVGYVSTSERFSSIPLFRQDPSGNLLMISGVPIDLRAPLDQTLHTISEQDALPASRSLSQLDGAFAALLWCEREQKLAVVTDFLGAQPLYFAQHEGLLLLATDLRGISASGLIDFDMDPACWGFFLSRGHLLGNRTLLKAVKRAEGGSIFLYDPLRGGLDSAGYWRWPERKPVRTLADVDFGLLLESLRATIRGYVVHHAGGSVLLSGGLDSRLILSLLLQEQLHPKVVILEHPDEFFNADGKFAVRAARLLHADYEFARPERSHYSTEAYLDFLIMNEVATPSLYLFIAQVSAHIRPDMRAVWEGVGPGSTMNAYAQPAGGFREYLASTPQSRDSQAWQAAALVFSPPLVDQMYEDFHAALKQEKAKYPDDEFGVREFHFRNKTRTRNLINPLQVYANDVLPFTPGLEREFFSMAINIPVTLKKDRTLMLEVYRRYFPEAATVPFCSGPKLVNPLRRSDFRYYALAAQLSFMRLYNNAHVRSVFRRLGRPLFSWDPSRLVDQVVGHVDLDHPDLNPGGVRSLQQAKGPFRGTIRVARETLFYWQVWRWLMDGTLTSRKKDAVLGTDVAAKES